METVKRITVYCVSLDRRLGYLFTFLQTQVTREIRYFCADTAEEMETRLCVDNECVYFVHFVDYFLYFFASSNFPQMDKNLQSIN